ncbi:uncharacterized protein LOC116025437 [Ipomoea triloba]|uniref:uncharacterized protein LOC116025437 n=1 Tax=Ipomoea triloba TaxID=35885 RepID=UPI00125E2CD3|nr:uncharacterized protein LOC116025437 [Ipomoea triloba]
MRVVGNDVWVRPARGRIKLNTDAAIDTTNNAMGLGWILRDDEGNFLATKNVRITGSNTVREAEAICLREALSWLKDTGMGAADVEMDSQLVFHAISYTSFYSTFGLLVDDIKELASSINDVEFRFVKRFANCVAHTVAREALSMSGCGEWFDIPPIFLVNCLSRDLMH